MGKFVKAHDDIGDVLACGESLGYEHEKELKNATKTLLTVVDNFMGNKFDEECAFELKRLRAGSKPLHKIFARRAESENERWKLSDRRERSTVRFQELVAQLWGHFEDMLEIGEKYLYPLAELVLVQLTEK